MPFAPGSWGSAATIPFFFLFLSTIPSLINALIISIVVLILGTWASNVYMASLDRHDPGEIVIDEVLGQFMTLTAGFYLFCAFNCDATFSTALTLASFILFRFFDIIKPWPIGWFDKHIKGGFGVMFDDILAAVYAIICLSIVKVMIL